MKEDSQPRGDTYSCQTSDGSKDQPAGTESAVFPVAVEQTAKATEDFEGGIIWNMGAQH